LRDFRSLPRAIQRRAEKALALLARNPDYPSLRTKKVQGAKDLWEARVSISYRITFHRTGDRIILRRIGTHDILDKESR